MFQRFSTLVFPLSCGEDKNTALAIFFFFLQVYILQGWPDS